MSGLCLDIKGNMINYIKALAYACGRESDILELGTGAEARPINLITGMEEGKIFDLYKALTLKDMPYEQNKTWIFSGIHAAKDLTLLCRVLAKRYPQFTPSLALTSEFLDDYQSCSAIFNICKELFGDKDEQSLIRRIENDCFH